VKKHDDDLAWKISVYSDGTATFNFPGSINGQCSLTISDYPYDEHKCSFMFTSWVHDGSELVLRLRPSNALDFGNYIYNNEWHIVGAEPKNVVQKYSCCPAPFYMTSFNIHVRRGASSYVSNYIIPSILIAILSIMMFTLPPEVGKRMGKYCACRQASLHSEIARIHSRTLVQFFSQLATQFYTVQRWKLG
jgi:nicotinic acetylcholine receptor